ncbi:uncharacterized protein C8Q71DRAFT_706652 [Rhodofomes roseus]|uniref:Transcription factor n=1 Tax=Rhodofomes roseus TaxID=34475 RepID=A0ABQ8KI27_9APHY|nr:uncharacterized protein C8Q71DRAFT_706652 [Rhodofomes roseus]KAH9837042.1 hypothetical protein C8Q71DRAFT_706652 [Rhodofomes roseus]
MRTIVPFASPLQLQMASATTAPSQDHLPPPHQHEPSRSGSPQHPDLSLLVHSHNSAPHPPSVSQSPRIDMAAAEQSLQTILDAAKQAPPPPPISNGPALSWMPPQAGPDNSHPVAGPSTPVQVSSHRTSTKRRLEDSDMSDPHRKIRRVVQDHVSNDPARVMPMTTVVCLHAAVAQKSYGSEKRFLCPPPVVHIEGPVWNLKSQQLAMAVVTENGDRTFEQKAPLDHNVNASFKFLHVSGTAKTKSFQLSLDIAEPPATGPDGTEQGNGRVWASFDSAPVTIISKPSKKTAKTRSIASCILAGGPVSLFNRINSQTVRTKYMTVDRGQLCASNVAWSAFTVNVITRPVTADSETPIVPGPQTVLYGSKIVLTDNVTGTPTPPLIIRKVDKGRITQDDGGPVSQMQKIALQRVNADGTRHYLSAAGPMPGTPGVVVPPTPGLANQAGSHPLLFQAPRVRDEVTNGQNMIIDEVDDYLCWTIVGISKFQYTFFDAFGQNNKIPDLPITPFPTLFTAPRYVPNTDYNAQPPRELLELTAANFFYHNPTTATVEPLDVYIGPLGPLRTRIFQATHTPFSGTVQPFIATTAVQGQLKFVPTAGTLTDVSHTPPVHGPLHTLVLVELPPKGDVLKALEEDAVPTSGENESGAPTKSRSRVEIISGRSLPLLFIRAYDGVGYHSGRAVACEYLFKNMNIDAVSGEKRSWISEHAAHAVEQSLNNWAWRII